MQMLHPPNFHVFVLFLFLFFLFLSEDVQWMRMLSYTIVTLLFVLCSIFKCLEAYC